MSEGVNFKEGMGLGVVNFQQRSWVRFLTEDVHETAKEYSIDDSESLCSIKHEIMNAESILKDNFDYINNLRDKSTFSKPLEIRTTVELARDTNKDIGIYENKVSKDLIILDLPILTDIGFIVDGLRYDMVGEYRNAHGWYVSDKEDPSKSHHQNISLELKTKFGGIYRVMYLRNNLVVKYGDSRSVPLAVFLKAISGYSYANILQEIGNNNRFLLHEFDFNTEPSMVECVKEVVHGLYGKKDITSEVDMIEFIKDKLFNPNYIKLGDESRVRVKKLLDFNNYTGLEFAEDVGGIKNGEVIDAVKLKLIGDIDRLKIRDKKGKIFTVKKTNVKDTLTVEEILNVINVFGLALEGVVPGQDRDSYENKVLEPLSSEFCEFVGRNLDLLNKHILSKVKKMNVDLSSVLNLDETGKMLGVKGSGAVVYDVGRLTDNIKKNKQSQLSEETNILATLSKGCKINSSAGKRVGLKARNIKATQYGRVCPIESPEGVNIGLTTTLTVMSDVDNNGFIVTPYYEISNGEIGEIVKVNALEEHGKFIAPWNADLTEDYVDARIDGEIKRVSVEMISFMEISPLQVISPSAAMIPCIENDYGKRALMASNMLRQAIVPIKKERSIVTTGVDSLVDIGVVRGKEIFERQFRVGNYTEEQQNDILTNAKLKLTGVYEDNGSKEIVLESDHSLLKGVRMLHRLPKYQSTFKGTSIHYNINNNTGLVWGSGDIVAASQDIDLTKVTVGNEVVKYGVNTDPSTIPGIEEKGMALGKNLTVMFKIHEGYNFEDAIIINQDLVGSGEMSVVGMFEVNSIIETGNRIVQKFTNQLPNVSDREISYLQPNGLPKNGTYLKGGQIVIGRTTTETVALAGGVEGSKPKSSSVRLGHNEEGFVISSHITGNKAYVTLGSVKGLEQGDKLAGRHGNKGVIGKIVPAIDLPFMEDGTVPDIVLNPLGVPSRMNIGQLIESTLGMLGVIEGKIQVTEPFSGNNLDYTLDKMKKMGFKEETVYDGRTGLKYERKSMIGVMYILRLEHTVEGKIVSLNLAGNNVNPKNLQPKKGKNVGGGQKIGEYLSWSFMSHGANKVLEDMYSLHSDDIKNKEVLKKKISSNPFSIEVEGENNSDKILLAYMRSMGLNVENTEEGLSLNPLTDEDIVRIAEGKSLSLTGDNLKTLHDIRIFGDEGIKTISNIVELREKYAYIDLGTEVVMPIWLSEHSFCNMIAYRTLDSENTSLMSRDLIGHIISGTRKVYNLREGQAPIVITGEEYRDLDDLDKENCQEGIRAIVNVLKSYDLNITLRHLKDSTNKRWEDYELGELSDSSRSDVEKELEMIISVEQFMKEYTLADFVVSKLLVIPVGYRPNFNDQSDSGRINNFDILYMNVMSTANKIKQDKEANKVYNAEFNRLYDRLGSFITTQGEGNLSVLKELTDHTTKNAVVRDQILGKRVEFSGRSVITPNPNLELTECGVPETMAYTMWKPHIISILKNNVDKLKDVGFNLLDTNLGREFSELVEIILNDNLSVFLNKYNWKDYKEGTKVFNEVKSVVKSLTTELIKTKKVLLNREPSLHKFSVQGFTPVLTTGQTIEIHPLICAGYNADFDGDQMAIYAPQNDSAIKEIEDKMCIESNIVNPKDGSIVLNHSQDIVLGVYYGTMCKNNEDTEQTPDKVVYKNSLSELKESVSFGECTPFDYAVVRTDVGIVKGYVGRIIFNSLIPHNEGFVKGEGSSLELKYNRKLKKGDLHKINKWVYEEFSKGETLKFYDRVKEYGYWMADYSNISICLNDFHSNVDVNSYIKKAENQVEVIDRAHMTGLISKQESKNAIINIWIDARDSIKEEIVESVGKNNNLFIIIDSGSRGSTNQFMEIMGMVGVVSDTERQMLETPVKSNYLNGLNVGEYFISSYNTRKGQIATALETGQVGYLTRRLIMLLEGIEVTEDICDSKGRNVKLEYSIEVEGNYLSQNDENFDKLKDTLGYKNKITQNTKDKISKLGLREVLTVLGDKEVKCQVKYSLEKFYKLYLKNRHAINESLPYLDRGCVTDKTISWIEEEKIKDIGIYTTLDCRVKDGVCKRCFGLKYETDDYAEIGDKVGFQAGQAIGEPSSQLTLNTFHQGSSGGSEKGGVDVVEQLISQTSSAQLADMALADGVIKIIKQGSEDVVDIGGVIHQLNIDNLIVEEGQEVKKGDSLTPGMINFKELAGSRGLEEMQLQFLKQYLETYLANNIFIYARHFELLVKMQTQNVRVIKPKDSGLKFGEIVNFNTVWEYNEKQEREEKDKIEFVFEVFGESKVMRYNSGIMTGLASERFKERSVRHIINRSKDKGKSSVSRLVLGNKLSQKETKLIKIDDSTDYVVESNVVDFEKGVLKGNFDFNILEVEQDFVEVEVDNELNFDIGLDLGLDLDLEVDTNSGNTVDFEGGEDVFIVDERDLAGF